MEKKKRHPLDVAGHLENFLYSLDENAPDDSDTSLRRMGKDLAESYLERDKKGNFKRSSEG